MDKVAWISNLSSIEQKIINMCLLDGYIGQPPEGELRDRFIETLYDSFNREKPIGFDTSMRDRLAKLISSNFTSGIIMLGDVIGFYTSLFNPEMTKEQFREKVSAYQEKRELRQYIDKVEETTLKDIEEQPQKYDWSAVKNIARPKKTEIVGFDTDNVKSLLVSNKAVMLYGVPGVGKSLAAIQLAHSIANDCDISIITINATMDYCDLIISQTVDNNSIKTVDGPYMRACKKAAEYIIQAGSIENAKKVVIILEEISRGNINNIFGEVLPSIENRGQEYNTRYNQTIVTPPNLYIIATANIKDKNAAIMDTAFIDRFRRVRVEPQWNNPDYIDYVIKDNNCSEIQQNIIKIIASGISDINSMIEKEDKDRLIGTRFIQRGVDINTIQNLIEDQLIPSINESIAGLDIDDTIISDIIMGIQTEIEDALDKYEQSKAINILNNSNNKLTLYYRGRGVQGTVEYIDNKFILKQGSKIAQTLVGSSGPTLYKMREHYRNYITAEGIIRQDLEFKSASSVAGFALGKPANGKLALTDARGVMFASLIGE